MKKLIRFLADAAILLPAFLYGQTDYVVSSWKSEASFTFVKFNDPLVKNFYKPTYVVPTSWTKRVGPWGTSNNTGSPPCPLNYDHTLYPWPSSRDLLLIKRISLPAGAKDVKVHLALDNGAVVYWNGVEISGGQFNHDDCAAEALPPGSLVPVGDKIFNAPDASPGDVATVHTLAIRGVWLSAKNYMDVKVTATRSKLGCLVMDCLFDKGE